MAWKLWSLVRAHQPDVVFLDVQMPGLDGFAVLKKLLEKGRKSPLPNIVFATAFDRYAVRAFEVNAVDYLLKPFDEKRVRHTLERVRTRLAEIAVGVLFRQLDRGRHGRERRIDLRSLLTSHAVDETAGCSGSPAGAAASSCEKHRCQNCSSSWRPSSARRAARYLLRIH